MRLTGHRGSYGTKPRMQIRGQRSDSFSSKPAHFHAGLADLLASFHPIAARYAFNPSTQCGIGFPVAFV